MEMKMTTTAQIPTPMHIQDSCSESKTEQDLITCALLFKPCLSEVVLYRAHSYWHTVVIMLFLGGGEHMASNYAFHFLLAAGYICLGSLFNFRRLLT